MSKITRRKRSPMPRQLLLVMSILHQASSFSLLTEYYRTSRSLILFAAENDSLQSKNVLEDRRISKRWNGNYKHASKKLSDVPKSKKLKMDLTVERTDGSKTTKSVLKKRQETLQHVLTKAILWKLYSEKFPSIEIEHDIGDPDYLPDVISLGENGNPLFWGESGRMKVHKAIDLMQRYPKAHIVHCRWDMTVEEISEPLRARLQELFDKDELGDDIVKRPGRFTFGALPLDMWRFIDEETGIIQINLDEVKMQELEFPKTKSSDNRF